MDVEGLIIALFALAGLAGSAWLFIVKRRRFLSEHRLLVAVTVLPLQPILITGLAVLLITQWGRLELSGVMLGVLAYVNGLVAFALVVAVQDLRQARRRRGVDHVSSPHPTDGGTGGFRG
ncbi:hypothetical protein [Nonomuraea sp. NPDC004354]